MQKAPEPLGFEGFLHSVWEGAVQSRRVRCLLLEEKVPSIARRMRWKGTGFFGDTDYVPCVQRHLIRRGVPPRHLPLKGEGLKSAQ